MRWWPKSRKTASHPGRTYRPPHIARPDLLPIRDWSHDALREYYETSFLAAKFVDTLVDDMVVRWRTFPEDDGRMAEAEEKYKVRLKLAHAMKMGRLYGTGMAVLITRDSQPSSPLDPQSVGNDDLISIITADNNSAEIIGIDDDLSSPNFGQPVAYRIRYGLNRSVDVDASRVLRFDGIPANMSDVRRESYSRDWGYSVLSRAITTLNQDADLAKAAIWLVGRASIDVLKINDFREALAAEGSGLVDADTKTLAEIGEAVNSQKDIYRMLFIDATDGFERHSYSFAGLGDLFDRAARRLAAAAGIPQTRFWGSSPMGLNATGDSDMRNYSLQIATMQQHLLSPVLKRLDNVLARSIGLPETLEYQWVPLIDMSEDDRAKVAKTRMEAVTSGVTAGLIDEEEGRRALQSEDVFGDLVPEDVPEPPEETEPGTPAFTTVQDDPAPPA